jgi:hypothetical protein
MAPSPNVCCGRVGPVAFEQSTSPVFYMLSQCPGSLSASLSIESATPLRARALPQRSVMPRR